MRSRFILPSRRVREASPTWRISVAWCSATFIYAVSILGNGLKIIAIAAASRDSSGAFSYIPAAKMTIAPFLRMNRALIVVLIVRTICAVVIAHFVNQARPVEKLWGIYGLYIGTRWFVGLLVPAIFLYMAHDCIKRRSKQSATGILYVAGALIFIGEIVALHLVRETGLPF